MAIYVSNRYRCQLCPDQYQPTSSECLWLEVSENVNSQSEFIVSVIYRHPVQTTVNNFLQSFSTCETHLSKSKANFYILGDFNINLHHANRSHSATEYINTIISNRAVPLITKPTTVTDTSSTIIDHIITNNFKSNLYPAVIKVDITDHYPILCIIEKPRTKTNSKPEITNSETNLLFLLMLSAKIFTLT